MVILDRHHRILYLNPAAENLLQGSAVNLRNQVLTSCFDAAHSLAALLERCQREQQTYALELELRARTLQQRAIFIDCRVEPYGLPEQGLLLVECNDISSRMRINRDKALRSQHGVGRQITRQLAHEIKNPLGGLRGAAQLLQRQIIDPSLHEYTDVIIGEADRLASLVDALLGPGGEPRKTQVNIHDVLEHVLRIVSSDVSVQRQWQRDYDPSLPLMYLDRDQMIQAVLNIVRNAIAATRGMQEGVICLRTRALTNDTIGEQRHRLIASIEIEDNGPGIAPELRDSIFYPLVTGRPDGTGIGLPLSQELINRHDGLIEFTSEPGCTVFQIRLPIEHEH
ncbi:MAG: nitrogen regulation protein NR(II) [Pseudomonadota bacterium]